MGNIRWTPDMDRALYSVRKQYPDAAWTVIASLLSEQAGILASSDMVRNRYNRVVEEETLVASYVDDASYYVDQPASDNYTNFRIGFFDIETTNLGAMMGRVLGMSVCDEFGEKNLISKTYADFNGKSILDDAPLVEWAMKELDNYDILVSWNGKLFDKPFLNARALKGLVVPLFPLKMHIDLMYQFKGSQSRFGSAKMDNVAKALGVQHQKTPLDFATWEKAAVGDKEALAEVMEHCEADILTMRDIFARSKKLIGSITR